MHLKTKTIQTGYHFFGEGIILFLLLFPFFYYAAQPVPYWSYLIHISIISVLYSILTLYSSRFIWYIIAAPLFFLSGFTLFSLPVIISGIIAVVLTWRYINLRKELFIDKEGAYLQWTTILVLVLVIFYQDATAIIYLLIQFFVVILGFITVQTIAHETETENQMPGHVVKLIFGIILSASAAVVILHFLGVPILFFLWNTVIINAWDILTTILIFIASIPMYFLEMLLHKLPDNTKENMHLNSGSPEGVHKDITDVSAVEANSPYIMIAVLILIAAMILYVALKAMKKKFNQEHIVQETLLTHYQKDDKAGKPSMFQRFKNKVSRQPSHPVRKVVYQLDKRLNKENKGRRSHETIEEWFSRIDLYADHSIYEKVRYGTGEITNEEIKKFKNELKQLDKDTSEKGV